MVNVGIHTIHGSYGYQKQMGDSNQLDRIHQDHHRVIGPRFPETITHENPTVFPMCSLFAKGKYGKIALTKKAIRGL